MMVIRRKPLLAVLGTILLVGGAFWGLTVFLKNSSLFSLKEIRISGLSRLQEKEVRKGLPVASGENLFRLDLEKLKEELESHPWIKRVYLARHLPHTLEIRVTEERPIAVTSLAGKLYFLNEEGETFSEAPDKALFAYPVVSFENRKLLKEAAFLKLLSWVREQNFYLPCYENVSQVYLAKDKILLLTKTGLKVRFEPGDLKDLKRAYKRLDKIVTYLYRNGLYDRAETIRLDYPEGRALLVYRQERR